MLVTLSCSVAGRLRREQPVPPGDRGAEHSVTCSRAVRHRTTLPGVLGGYESSANYEIIDTPEGPVDRGGCLNLLTPPRTMTSTADGIAPNSCLVEVQKWIHPARAAS